MVNANSIRDYFKNMLARELTNTEVNMIEVAYERGRQSIYDEFTSALKNGALSK